MNIPTYQDHIGLWANKLKAWMPKTIFDAHVHLGPPELMAPFSPQRLKEALSTFSGMTWEQLEAMYAQCFSEKRVAGLIAFGWPLREVDMDAANDYIIGLMLRDARVKGFLLAHPNDAGHSRRTFVRGMARGVRFLGVKPYFDFLGKSNYVTTMPEFIPEDLLRFMNEEGLIMMLHTSGRGMGVPENQAYVRGVLERYPRVRIILAHMGRYLEVEEFFRFIDSGLTEMPNLYLEMSSASRDDVYRRTLERPETHDRLVFGTDMPFGLLTGVEAWSPETGPVFITRDKYAWSNEKIDRIFAAQASRLTFNTYHVIDAFKTALESVTSDAREREAIKRKVFHDNAAGLFQT